MPSTFANLLYHVVFSTKNRARLIAPDWHDELHGYIGGIVRSEGGVLLAAGGTADHVHLLVKLKPATAIADAVAKVKANSSKWLNDERFPDRRFAWQEGYAAFSVSESAVEDVRRYIATQKEHHRRMTFHEELAAILTKHGIEFDPARL
jgi:REP element-mobilizing transposase RayT